MLYYLDKVPAQLHEEFTIAAEVANISSRFLLWREDNLNLAFGGEILPSSLCSDVYLWITLNKARITPTYLRRGYRQMRQYFASLPWRPLAECALSAPADERFLRCCGFLPEVQLDDRTLYIRSAKCS